MLKLVKICKWNLIASLNGEPHPYACIKRLNLSSSCICDIETSDAIKCDIWDDVKKIISASIAANLKPSIVSIFVRDSKEVAKKTKSDLHVSAVDESCLTSQGYLFDLPF